MDLEGKAGIVTGASSGIGRATAILMGGYGARVVLASRRKVETEETAQAVEKAGGEAVVLLTDLTQPSQVQALVDGAVSTFGRIDFAFNNGGNGIGSWLGASMPTTAATAPPSTPSSKVIGTKACQLKNGLPLMTTG